LTALVRDRGVDYLRAFATVFAGYESAETGQAVDVAEFMARHGLA
jgi:hypothetical protein